MVPELGSVSREGIVLRGHRILLPKTLRSRVIDLAHAGHQGMVKTKRLIRSRVWFEGIDNAVSDHGQPMKSTHRKRLLEKGLFNTFGAPVVQQVRRRLTISVAQVQRVCKEMGLQT